MSSNLFIDNIILVFLYKITILTGCNQGGAEWINTCDLISISHNRKNLLTDPNSLTREKMRTKITLPDQVGIGSVSRQARSSVRKIQRRAEESH